MGSGVCVFCSWLLECQHLARLQRCINVGFSEVPMAGLVTNDSQKLVFRVYLFSDKNEHKYPFTFRNYSNPSNCELYVVKVSKVEVFCSDHLQSKIRKRLDNLYQVTAYMTL